MGKNKIELKSNKFTSLVYNVLVGTYKLQESKLFSKFWYELWDYSIRNFKGSVRTKIHGFPVFVNNGYTYPIYSKKFKNLNKPLVELIYQTFAQKNEEIIFIDIGAAIGDTILLVRNKCPKMVSKFYCIDGDKEFSTYLNENVGHFPNTHVLFAQLSSSSHPIRELIRTHPGTASAQGNNYVTSISFDELIAIENPTAIDVIKIDVDGYDGEVLKGSAETLKKFKPNIIFEWHPILCKQTGNSWTDIFDVLDQNDYETLIWFNKYGYFSHFSTTNHDVSLLSGYCLHSNDDWHYDVIALHKDSKIDKFAVADLKFSKI